MHHSPQEIGFWEYTCPGHGSVEHYTADEWDILLDDMGTGGFNSLVLGIKWLTTGYRSRYHWLDQNEAVSTIASDNAVLHHALRGARARGIRTWLLVVGSIFDVAAFGFAPASSQEGVLGSRSYDLDQPGVRERILLLYEEVVQLFGAEADGLIVELEFCDSEAPHRVPLYEAWALEHGRMSLEAMKGAPLEPRGYPQLDWRDFTTTRRIELLQAIESVVRAAGFRGAIANLVEMVNAPGLVIRNVNLEMMRQALPHWPIVTYDHLYDRRLNRAATREFCMEGPARAGMEVCFLTRGVMTFTWPPDAPALDLREQWQLSLEDAAIGQPARLWFMGSEARSDGMVCSHLKLPAWGYPDGRQARLALMKLSGEILGRPPGG